MGRRYSFTDDALSNLAVYDVTPGEVWEALHGSRRVIRHLGELTVVYAVSRRGRRLVVLLAEPAHDDHDFDILSARDMSDSEVKRYEEVLRGWRR
ncbi:hypothetical protein Ais01nite_49620 [Asanoa ishikariensis]|uniref:hypothetical protein n=1 Tax=Asanoa TaxID=195964 RepID=UPI001A49965C|nr:MULTISPECIES: hypothetical protein [Asanoa]GIF66927.1 hypothetical protein Ais01nite_49620 [Asanoa ishikariensis]